MRNVRMIASATLIVATLLAACSTSSESTTPTPSGSSTTIETVSDGLPDPTAPASITTTITAPATTIAPTTTPPTSITTTVVSTTTVTTPTTAPPATPTSDTVLVYGGGPYDGAWQRLGAWDGTGWVELADDEPFASATIDLVAVASVDLPAVVSTATYTMPDYWCVDLPLHVGLDPDVTLPESPLGWGYGAIAVTADWPLQPRPVLAVGLDADIYQQVGEQLLAGRPNIDPTNGIVVQVLRADLEGDGTEEVLVSFRYLSAPDFGVVGDFSIVYLRRIGVGGAVEDEIVFEHLVPEPSDPPFPAPGRGSVAAVADLNGDGLMEVAIGSSYWEYGQIEVFELDGGSLKPVMFGGCGV